MSRSKLRSLLRMMLLAGSSIGAFWSPAFAQQVPAALATASGFVFTANEFGNSISRIDLTTGKVETVPVTIAAHNVQVTADGQFLLAVGAAVAGDHEETAVGGQSEMDMDAKGLLLIFVTGAKVRAGLVRRIDSGG